MLITSAQMSGFEYGPAFDAVDIGIIVLDQQHRIAGWNDWIARVSRQPKEAVLGNSLYDIFPAARGTRLFSVISNSFEAGSSSILTHTLNALLPLRGNGGEELVHNIIVRPVSSGGSVYCLLQINDVTVSATREQVLRERQNARYHAIVDTAPDAIVTTDVARTIQWVNGAAEHVFGYASSDLVGRKIDVLVERAEVLTRAFVTDRNDMETALQVIGRRKDGSPRHFEMSFAHWRADERVFVTTIWRDVSERMTAEETLRDSESRHRALLEALPQLVWSCRADGECDYVNPRWQEYTGAPFEQQLGSRWIEVVHEPDRQGLLAAWNSALANGGVLDFDTRLRGANGSYRSFKMRSIPVRGADGSITRWLGTATDITDLVEAQDTLRRSNEELEVRVADRTREREVALRQLHESQKMESIGQLTGGVAHDFNNLLAVILSSLTLLKKRVPPDPRILQLLDGAMQGVDRGATLTKRLLAFARRQELKPEAVELQKLVPDVLDFLRQSVGPGISIVVEIPPDIAPVKVDANQLELALMNLAVNARDAMPKGGTLTIACRGETTTGLVKRPTALLRGDYVRIDVVDTGHGMNEATLAKAMEPFFTTKGVGKGTGLGLSMVHGLTAQSGGALHIASQLGKGTAVTLWLPQARREDFIQAAERQIAPLAETPRQKLTILVVDDDALVSMNTADMLIDLGHRVSEASSGTDALEKLRSNGKFDVVVTDYAMPGMNGLDLATEIRRTNPALPIILATGYADLPHDAPLEFPRLGKPYTQEQLAKTLESAVK